MLTCSPSSLFQDCFCLTLCGGAMAKSLRAVELMYANNVATTMQISIGTMRANVRGTCNHKSKSS